MGLDDEYELETVDEENQVEYELEEDPYPEKEEDSSSYQAVDEDFLQELEEQRQKQRELQRPTTQKDDFRQEVAEWVEQGRSGTDIADIAQAQRGVARRTDAIRQRIEAQRSGEDGREEA